MHLFHLINSLLHSQFNQLAHFQILKYFRVTLMAKDHGITSLFDVSVSYIGEPIY
jgi:hypothetical protein